MEFMTIYGKSKFLDDTTISIKIGVVAVGNELKITWDMILAFASAIVVLEKGIDALIRLTRPEKQNKARLERVERYVAHDFKRLEKASYVHQVVLETLVLILDHLIDGNNVERMKATRAMLQSKIVNLSTEDSPGEKF